MYYFITADSVCVCVCVNIDGNNNFISCGNGILWNHGENSLVFVKYNHLMIPHT